MINKIIFTSGYFIWIHVGHIELFKRARKLGDELVVILNNDEQQKLKYGKIIVPENERKKIIEAIWGVGQCYISMDKDRTVCKTIESLYKQYSSSLIKTEIIFAKGGDRFKKEIPEKAICDKLGIKIIDGLGDKIQSSSDLLKQIKY